jgi:phenylalanyl-tRNA synthetase beta subunit
MAQGTRDSRNSFHDNSREDLIEEVVRIYGYDKMPERSTMTIVAGRVSDAEKVTDVTRGRLTGLGYFETLTNRLAFGNTTCTPTPNNSDKPGWVSIGWTV